MHWHRIEGRTGRLAGYILVSLGVLAAISGGTWDVTFHLLNKPETFFSAPHSMLYGGVAAALAGALAVASSASRRRGDAGGFWWGWPSKLVVAGVAMLVAAGPADFMWHSAFGLDGLLSPSHSVLAGGMAAASIGAAAGIVKLYRHQKKEIPVALVVAAMLPVWLVASGLVQMFSLPLSETAFFNFNPEPRAAAVAATLGLPFVTAAVLSASWAALAAKRRGRRFGVMTALAGAFVAVSALASVVPNAALAPTIPFYVGVLVPIAAADAVMSQRIGSSAAISTAMAGALIGLSFLMLYYPLITHTYNRVLDNRMVWASLTATIYFEMMGRLFPLVAVPAAAMGIAGAIAGAKIGGCRAIDKDMLYQQPSAAERERDSNN
jgi:hypothetical protein